MFINKLVFHLPHCVQIEAIEAQADFRLDQWKESKKWEAPGRVLDPAYHMLASLIIPIDQEVGTGHWSFVMISTDHCNISLVSDDDARLTLFFSLSLQRASVLPLRYTRALGLLHCWFWLPSCCLCWSYLFSIPDTVVQNILVSQ